MKQHASFRIALVLLAAGLVVAITWARATPYDAARGMEKQAMAAKGQAPTAEAKALLLRSIQAPPPGAARLGADAARLGPLRSITYLGWLKTVPLPGLGRRVDNFEVTYRDGTLVWHVSPATGGARPIVVYFSPAPMTPGQIIKAYATPAGIPWPVQLAVQLGVLLLFALIGRKLLRIRL